MEGTWVDSKAFPLNQIFSDTYEVDFYQREYVWQREQIEDLINDLSNEFLKNWNDSDKNKSYEVCMDYDPYFMGEIIISTTESKRNAIIDGQQRITSFSLLLIYLLNNYKHIDDFPEKDVNDLIYKNHFGKMKFKLDIDDRNNCMVGLYNNGQYIPQNDDSISITNIVNRYNDIAEAWNNRIDNEVVVYFTYWLLYRVFFSKVTTNSDDFAYVIFETMNDRGLPLTQVEMLRSYLLANINLERREKAMTKFDSVVEMLTNIKLSSKSKAEFEFFKMFFRGHFAEDLSQGKHSKSDFTIIGQSFHRWVRDKKEMLKLKTEDDYYEFISKIEYFAGVYQKINKIIESRNTTDYLYLIVNSDYSFTLQPALILAAVKYQDDDTVVDEKIKIVSKYLTKILTWRVWNHWMISQSALESPIYNLCKKLRDKSTEEIKEILNSNPIDIPNLENSPTLNQQNRQKLRVLLSLITEIVARESNEPNYMLNKNDNIEVEHIWSDHYEEHIDEFDLEEDFINVRNNIGDLLVLPKSFNASYGDQPYSVKVKQYFSQNILAQTLNEQKYHNNPSFIKFKNESGLDFKSYEEFKKNSISERAELYKSILQWNWK